MLRKTEKTFDEVLQDAKQFCEGKKTTVGQKGDLAGSAADVLKQSAAAQKAGAQFSKASAVGAGQAEREAKGKEDLQTSKSEKQKSLDKIAKAIDAYQKADKEANFYDPLVGLQGALNQVNVKTLVATESTFAAFKGKTVGNESTKTLDTVKTAVAGRIDAHDNFLAEIAKLPKVIQKMRDSADKAPDTVAGLGEKKKYEEKAVVLETLLTSLTQGENFLKTKNGLFKAGEAIRTAKSGMSGAGASAGEAATLVNKLHDTLKETQKQFSRPELKVDVSLEVKAEGPRPPSPERKG